MPIKKSDLKVLRYIYRHKNVTLRSLSKKFPHFDIDSSCYIHYTDHRLDDDSGFPIGTLSPDEIVSLSNDGILVVESHQFFNLEYVLSSLVIPIIVGVFSSIITALILLFIG